jgi:hypothetical protein
VIVAVVAVVATIAAPFALAYRFRRIDGWRDLARPTTVFGVIVLASLVAYAALEETGVGGWSQRIAAVIVPVGIVMLAVRVRDSAHARGDHVLLRPDVPVRVPDIGVDP